MVVQFRGAEPEAGTSTGQSTGTNDPHRENPADCSRASFRRSICGVFPERTRKMSFGMPLSCSAQRDGRVVAAYLISSYLSLVSFLAADLYLILS